jgi:hypothetical protein
MVSVGSSRPATYLRFVRQAASIHGRAKALNQPIHRQRDANRVGNVETNRTQLNHNQPVGELNPLDTMRLRVVEPNNITSP